MKEVVNSKQRIPEEYLVAAYNNLGITSNRLGNYDEALEYYKLAENHIKDDVIRNKYLADIYINTARIFTFKKSFNTAIEYFEKGMRIYLNSKNPEKRILQNISSALLNIGIAYYEAQDYQLSLNYLYRSLEFKIGNELSGIAFVYLNISKNFIKVNQLEEASENFLKAIKSFNEEFPEDNYRFAEILFDYGLFLRSTGKINEALNAHCKALDICIKNYGTKHSLVSQSYKHIGDDYLNQNKYRIALQYYQKSLNAVVYNFNDTSIFSNPSIDSVLFNLRLLENLKAKTVALERFSEDQNIYSKKLFILNKCLQTIDLALQLIDRIRNDYMSEESRIYLADNEKETYLSAIHSAKALYDLTGETIYVRKMYETAAKAKSAILRNKITENDLLWSAGIPDSLNSQRTGLSANIAAYNNLLLEESQERAPDSSKISLWKDALFEMNREKERINAIINGNYPQIREILLKTEPLPPDEIQKHLHRDETLVDYLLSNKYTDGKRDLYTFLITRDTIKFIMSSLDSLFLKNAGIIRDHTPGDSFSDYTGALSYMYRELVKPAEGDFPGKRLIIIPDEEISWLPFDAFLVSRPGKEQTDYEGLTYMVKQYSVSYGYSSSLIWGRNGRLKRGGKVFAFSPDYDNEASGILTGAGKEILSILRWFRGSEFTGALATETGFRQAIVYPGLFHLAMHLVTDSLNSEYSFLAFSREEESAEDGRLYNYEISLMRMRSPMVVLSACNSGSGTLYHGEGVMSIARGFLLAGASSVVKTSWEVNDETSAGIMIRFYRNLSKGMNKSDALQNAKLNHLEQSIPALSDPWYWAAYEILGDNSPVSRKMTGIFFVSVAIALLAGALVLYLRRRRILSERSE